MNKKISTLSCLALSLLVVPAYGAKKDSKHYYDIFLNREKAVSAEIVNYNAAKDEVKKTKSLEVAAPAYNKVQNVFENLVTLGAQRNKAHARWVRSVTNKETLTDRLVDLSDDAKQIIVKHDKISKGVGITAALTAAAGIGYFAHQQYKKSKNKLNS